MALDKLNDLWDEDGGWNVTSVTASLTALGADDVDAEVEALLDVLWVPDHVHVEDAGLVEAVDDGLGWDADGGDEELGPGLDHDVDELVELALGVVVAVRKKAVSFVILHVNVGTNCAEGNIICTYLVLRAEPPTCGSRRSTPNGAFLSFR
jgi:hypothetical protein